MKIVVFGLSISSAWGNGHATLLRGLFKALHQQGHEVHFFEKDVPYYASHRDAAAFPFVKLHLYSELGDCLSVAKREVTEADAAIVTSYCPDGAAASELILACSAGRTVFYDMDTPVTLLRVERGEAVPYLPAGGLSGFDLVLSYTGGEALTQLQTRLGARNVASLYGWVDASAYYPVQPVAEYQAALSYLGTYAADRQHAFDELFLAAARLLPEMPLVVGGAMYPDKEHWPANVRHFEHVSPADHRKFYSSSPVTLSVTRASMAAMGHCPSGRLFEAAACGTAVLSDWWTGLDSFFTPGEEILIAHSTADAVAALQADRQLIGRIGALARERTLDCHTSELRAQRLLKLLEQPGSNELNTGEMGHVGNHTGRRNGIEDTAASLLEGTAAGR